MRAPLLLLLPSLLAATAGWAQPPALPEQVTCELAESPENHLVFDKNAPSITVVWHMQSHDGSSKDWKEPWVDSSHASGYPYDFNHNCQSGFALTESQPKTYSFSYSCQSFTRGVLTIQPDGNSYFHAETRFNDGTSVKDQKLTHCKW